MRHCLEEQKIKIKTKTKISKKKIDLQVLPSTSLGQELWVPTLPLATCQGKCFPSLSFSDNLQGTAASGAAIPGMSSGRAQHRWGRAQAGDRARSLPPGRVLGQPHSPPPQAPRLPHARKGLGLCHSTSQHPGFQGIPSPEGAPAGPIGELDRKSSAPMDCVSQRAESPLLPTPCRAPLPSRGWGMLCPVQCQGPPSCCAPSG